MKDKKIKKEIIKYKDRIRYDHNVKQVISNKEILGYIVKHVIKGYKDKSIEEIKEMIGEVINDVKISEEEKGEIVLDILFNIKEKKEILMYINIEIQNDVKQRYDLVTRSIMYASKLISRQLGKEVRNSSYEKMKKVYSIWICTNGYRELKGGIDYYEIKRTSKYRKNKRDEKYDLIESVIIYLEEGNKDKLIGMLSTLLSSRIKAKEKIKILENTYHINMKEHVKEVEKMCNLGEGIFREGVDEGISLGFNKGQKEGFDQGKLETISNIYKNTDMSLDEVLGALDISDKLKDIYKKKLEHLDK